MELAPQKKAYGMPEAAKVSGICRTKLYAAMNAGKLKTVKIGKRRLVRPEALDAFLAAHEA